MQAVCLALHAPFQGDFFWSEMPCSVRDGLEGCYLLPDDDDD
jgi:hypothetical protein